MNDVILYGTADSGSTAPLPHGLLAQWEALPEAVRSWVFVAIGLTVCIAFAVRFTRSTI